MKYFEVYYKDTLTPIPTFMVVVPALNVLEAFFRLYDMGYQPINVKQLGMQFIQWGK